jgi:hypothetical protein
VRRQTSRNSLASPTPLNKALTWLPFCLVSGFEKNGQSRVRNIDIRVVLFWDQNKYLNALKFDWYKLRDVANKSSGFKLTILSQEELVKFFENKRPLSSYL